MNKMLLSVIAVCSILLSGCTTDKDIRNKMAKALQEDPTILTNAIEKHPAEFITALQNAAKNAQEAMAKTKDDEEKKQLEESFTKPLMAEIRSEV